MIVGAVLLLAAELDKGAISKAKQSIIVSFIVFFLVGVAKKLQLVTLL